MDREEMAFAMTRWSDKITYRQALAFCVWWFVIGVSIGWMLR